MMRNRLFPGCLIAGFAGLLGWGSCSAGDLFHRHGHQSDCGCSQPTPQVSHTHSAVEGSFAAALAVPACCGVGGGLAQVGNLYGLEGAYGGNSLDGRHGSPASGSFLSGYEGLPNMDGGGIHYRYPYHSYRRPWAHPGTPSTNVTIVW